MNNIDQIIRDICKNNNIKLTETSDKWLKILEKNHKIHYIVGYKFDLNNHGIGNILDDKGLFYDLCKFKNIPIVYQKVLFNEYNKDDVLNFFHENNNEIIIKGNIGTCGKEVFKVDDENKLFEVIDKLFLSQYSISLSPYYHIKNEYRVILLNRVPKIIYGKEKPMVIGDGKTSLEQLAIEYNDYYKINKIDNSDYIPKKDEKVTLNYQFNLSRGAKMFLDIDKDLKEEIISLALKVVNNFDITFASVDIIYTTNDKLLVMEANSGVMMDNYIRFNKKEGYDKAYNIYNEAINLMFEKK